MDIRGKNYAKTIQDRDPNFRDKNGQLYLVRCFNCDSDRGRENYVMNISAGVCA